LVSSPLDPPTGLNGDPDSNEIQLSWNSVTVSTFSGYNLYRSTSSGSGFTKINMSLITTNSHNDSELEPKTTYYYKIASVNIDNIEGERSIEIEETTLNWIIATYGPPGDTPGGLTWDGTYLWICCTGSTSAGKVYKIDSSTFSVLNEYDDRGVGFGLAWDGTYLWQYGWDHNNSKIYKMSPNDYSMIDYYSAPGNEQGSGLAFDGTNLWCACGDTLYKLNSSDCSVISSYESPTWYSKGLTFDGTYLWLTSYYSLYKIDPTDCTVLATYNADLDLYQNFEGGVAFDGTNLWLGCSWNFDPDKIFKVLHSAVR